MRSKIVPILMAAVGILLRGVPIWAQPLWYDENFSILVARLPLDRLLQATAGDVHPPLWYLLCWPFSHLAFIPAWAAVRLPAMIFGVAAIWVWWQILVIMVKSPKIRLVAFGLFCLLPQQIYYSQEGRMYSLLSLLVLICWLAILTRHWIVLAIAAALMLYTHNYGLFYLAALGLAGLIHDRRSARHLLLSLAASMLAFTPWMALVLQQMDGIGGQYWIMHFTFASILGDFAQAIFSHGLLDADTVNIAVLYGVLIWILIWSLRRRSLDLRLVVLAFVPLALAVLMSLVWHPLLLARALVPSGVFLVLLIADPLEELGTRPALVLASFLAPVLFVNLIAVVLRSTWADESIYREIQAIELIDSQWQPGDLLYLADDGTYISGAPSWREINNVLRVEPCGTVRGGITPLTRSALGIDTGPLPAVTGRVWSVTALTPLNTPCENEIMASQGLLDADPLYCAQDNALVQTCVYLHQ